MIRLILLSAAAIPVAVALNSQSRSASEPAGTLAEAALAQRETPASIWWADYDADGLEDALAITGAGGPQLLRNLGDGEFANATQSAGLAGASGARFAAWGDVDGDGAPDLYVGTATGPKLYLNQSGGTFVEAAARSGLAHTSADRDAHFLDYDHDRRLDLHVQTATGDLLYRGVGAGQFQRVDLGLAGAPSATVVVGAHEHAETPAAPAATAAGEADQARSAGRTASGGAATRGAGRPANPVKTRQPAPTPPGSYASVPCAFVNASASSVFDQTTNQCLLASSQGTLGNLYPLSTDFNVNAAGNVGIGVNNAADRLHVNNGDIRISGSAGRELVLYDGSGQIAVRLDANAAGDANNIQLRRNGKVAYQFAGNSTGYVRRFFHAPTGQSVVNTGTSAADESGFIEVLDTTGGINVWLDSDNDQNVANGIGAGSVNVRSRGTGGGGGTVNVQNNDGNTRAILTGGPSNGAARFEMFDTTGSRTVLVNGDSGTGGDLFMFNVAGTKTIDIDSDNSGAGVIEVGNGFSFAPRIILDGDGPADDGGAITVKAADGSNTVFLEGEAEGSGGAIRVRHDTGAETIRLQGDNGRNSGVIGMWDRAGAAVQTVLIEAIDGFGTGASFQVFAPNGNTVMDFDAGGIEPQFLLLEHDGSVMYSFVQNTQAIKNGAGVTTISHNGNTGGKSAVQMTDSYGQRLLYCMESPEVWFEDFGSAELVNGSVRVDLDPVFLETITIDERNPMRVFVSLNGECEGVWIEKGVSYFVVHERDGGTSDVAFDWRLVAKRRGLEEFRLDPFFEATDPDGDEPTNPAGVLAPQDGEEAVEDTIDVESEAGSRTAPSPPESGDSGLVEKLRTLVPVDSTKGADEAR